ncbi:isocitrate lyase/phosphoenolpyruvate mutase family protein [Streptacidiphilus sp. P02-A3a]|uniref:isocitrate lyase/PEP mutase family protein n=1 Tax=Streptacidiphilus sp. P02-A3a TaxID=2704468 RepID=UPI0015FBD3A0|nr:isocitrate lyase/phosphoenolpyruvate mutase family protein [Streptacidiphilus sp. P02-A3a]QMU67693.1 isocitrate lyase/phosphoenolpyruvate mutase family protein [Streptacidiphilus sp. P02-A3a]
MTANSTAAANAAQQDKALLFHSLHTSAAPLALANVWDVAGARLVQQAGAPAIATTSAGVAWGLGAADGGGLGREDALALLARVVAAVEVPVTADIETGFGATPAEVAETIRGVLATGAVGVNLEDGLAAGEQTEDSPLRPVAEQAERLAAARAAADAAGISLFVNARVDTYLYDAGEPETRLQDTLTRAAAYLAAGADGIFVPGLSDPLVIAALAEVVTGPLNVSGRPGLPTVAELGKLGVARVSLGATVAEAAYAVVRRAAQELAEQGGYSALTEAIPYPDLNALMS